VLRLVSAQATAAAFGPSFNTRAIAKTTTRKAEATADAGVIARWCDGVDDADSLAEAEDVGLQECTAVVKRIGLLNEAPLVAVKLYAGFPAPVESVPSHPESSENSEQQEYVPSDSIHALVSDRRFGVFKPSLLMRIATKIGALLRTQRKN